MNARTAQPLRVAGCLLALAVATPATLPAAGPFLFHALTPCRAIDTRNAPGPAGGPALSHGAAPPRSFPISGTCGIPAGAAAVAASFTVLEPGVAGYIAAYPSDAAAPVVATVSFPAAVDAESNSAIVPLSGAGALSVSLTAPPAGTAHLVIDVSGYFAPP